jgi:hypothetical protein
MNLQSRPQKAAATEDHVAKKAGALVVCLGLENRLFRPGEDLPGLLAIQQDGSQAIAVVAVRSVVELDPALLPAGTAPSHHPSLAMPIR